MAQAVTFVKQLKLIKKWIKQMGFKVLKLSHECLDINTNVGIIDTLISVFYKQVLV